MHCHILGIGGTFMSALAILARQAGHKITGSDANCYPPISDLLKEEGILWTEGFEDTTDALKADCVIVGNAISRGTPVLEAVINASKNYCSGPQWLSENLLVSSRVLAISGTHGKTTTTSMLAFILDEAGLNPGFLIGGVSPNFNTSARLGKGEWFVIEADEYDSAFFDKRPKLMHYRPEVAVINNLEFDHADIYQNLEAIQQQFHFYLKTLPSKGVLIAPRDDKALAEVRERGVFCNYESRALDGDAVWRAEILDETGSNFRVLYKNTSQAEVKWPLIGKINVENGLTAIAAAYHAGVSIETAAKALREFKPIKRRMEIKYSEDGITIYDDFAHHPTAIARTLEALKASKRHKRILLVLEFASYTMRSGVHKDNLRESFRDVDKMFVLDPKGFDLRSVSESWPCEVNILPNTQKIIEELTKNVTTGDAIVVMSNRGFDNLQQQLVERMASIVPA